MNATPDACHWEICPAGAQPGGCGRLPWDPDELVAKIEACQQAARENELTAPSQPYMRHAHLLPPRHEFDTLDAYVRVLKMLQRCLANPANTPRFAMFAPDADARVANAEALMRWRADQYDSPDREQAYALAALRGEADIVANCPKGGGPGRKKGETTIYASPPTPWAPSSTQEHWSAPGWKMNCCTRPGCAGWSTTTARSSAKKPSPRG